MGITLHYRGRAKSDRAIDAILNDVFMFGALRAEQGWRATMSDDGAGRLEAWEDAGRPDDPLHEHGLAPDEPVRRVVLVPPRRCEPFVLGFTRTLELAPAFTKTQYAPWPVHVALVGLLREISTHFEELEVHDESGLWETGDLDAARERFETLLGAINDLADDLGAEPPPDDDWPPSPDADGELDRDLGFDGPDGGRPCR